MKFKVEENDVLDGSFIMIYNSKKNLLKDYNTSSPILREFLNRNDIFSIKINYGRFWYKFSRIFE